MDLQQVKQALSDAGIEIYQSVADELQIAERVRLHLMDSSVRVKVNPRVVVVFTARCQRSDFPSSPPEELFAKVRNAVGPHAGARGYAESSHQVVEVTNPANPKQTLDVWYEVTYTKAQEDPEAMIDEVQWALTVEKYVSG